VSNILICNTALSVPVFNGNLRRNLKVVCFLATEHHLDLLIPDAAFNPPIPAQLNPSGEIYASARTTNLSCPQPLPQCVTTPRRTKHATISLTSVFLNN
jgi:hypothetical protein